MRKCKEADEIRRPVPTTQRTDMVVKAFDAPNEFSFHMLGDPELELYRLANVKSAIFAVPIVSNGLEIASAVGPSAGNPALKL